MKHLLFLILMIMSSGLAGAESRIFILADVIAGPKPVFTFQGKGSEKMELKMEENLQIITTNKVGKFRVLKDGAAFKYKDDSPMVLDIQNGRSYFLRQNHEFQTWELSDITKDLPNKAVVAVITADPGAPASLEYFTVGPSEQTGITFKKPNFYFECRFVGLEKGNYGVFAQDFARKSFAPKDEFGDPVLHPLTSGFYNIRITSSSDFVKVTEVPVQAAP